MILSVEVSVSSVGECKVDSGERGGEAHSLLNNSLPLTYSLTTYLFNTANIALLTHFTLKSTLIYHLNNQLDYIIRHFVLYLADKAGNTKTNIQQLNLLS